MTVYYPDLSNDNWGSEDLTDQGRQKLMAFLGQGLPYAAISHKMSQGSDYVDPYGAICQTWCADHNVAFMGYHFATTDPAAAQVSNWQAAGGGANVMIDFEQLDANAHPALNMGLFWDLVYAFNAADINVALVYLPQWYADDISADLSPLAPSEIALVSSAYPLGYSIGPPADLYRGCDGDDGEGWAPYCGGPVPTIWQFTCTASIGGINVDCNAFRGTAAQLAAVFGQ